MKHRFHWESDRRCNLVNFLINIVGLLIIDIGAMIYGASSETGSFKFFMLLLVTNTIGGLLYRYKMN